MRKIWIVFGTTGEYSDRCEWPVAAFLTEDGAQKRVDEATAWYLQSGGKDIRALSWGQRGGMKNPHDPDMSVDYTGTSWYVIETNLHD